MEHMQVEVESVDSGASDGDVTDNITSSTQVTVTQAAKIDEDQDDRAFDGEVKTGCNMELTSKINQTLSTMKCEDDVENNVRASGTSAENGRNQDQTNRTNLLISETEGDGEKIETVVVSREYATKTPDCPVKIEPDEQMSITCNTSTSETQGDEKDVGNDSIALDSGANEGNNAKKSPQGGSKKKKVNLAFARKKRLEQHALWILRMERKFQESKVRPVSEMNTSELIEDLTRTEKTIDSIDAALRQITCSTSFAKQKKALQVFSKNAPIFDLPAAEGNMYADVNVSVNAERQMSDWRLVRRVKSSVLGLGKSGKVMMKKERMQKLLKESRAAVAANRKRPFFRTFTALKELDRRQENDLVVVSQLRTIGNDPEDPDLKRYCLSCGKVLKDSQEVVKHLFEESIGKEDISQLFAWESRNRCSFLGVFLNIYHKYFRFGAGPRIHCYFCGVILTSCSEIINHLQAIHPLIFTSLTFELLPRCFVCWAKIHSTEGLKSHYRTIHKIDDADQMQTYISCNFYGDLWEQIVGGMEGQIIYCRLCDFKCAQGAKSLFVKHVRQIHSGMSSTDCSDCREHLFRLQSK